MLGFIGKWAGSKGMGRIPNLIGLNKNQARQALQDAGFNYGNEDEETQSDESLTNKVKSQGTPHNDLVDYETSINYVIHTFSFTPFSVFGFSPTPPFSVFGFSPTPPEAFSVFGFSPTPPEAFSVFGFSPTPPEAFSVFGFSPTPPESECPTCPDPGAWSDWGICDGGQQFRTRTNYETVGAPPSGCCIPWIESESRNCEAAFSVFGFSPTPPFSVFGFSPTSSCPACPDPGSWGPWSACSNGQRCRERSNYETVGDPPNGCCIPWTEQQCEACGTAFSVFGFSPTPPEAFSVFGFSPTPPEAFSVFGFSPTPPASGCEPCSYPYEGQYGPSGSNCGTCHF
jgi:hypothetical protein